MSKGSKDRTTDPKAFRDSYDKISWQGGSSQVARQPHKLKVVGSNPTLAPKSK